MNHRAIWEGGLSLVGAAIASTWLHGILDFSRSCRALSREPFCTPGPEQATEGMTVVKFRRA